MLFNKKKKSVISLTPVMIGDAEIRIPIATLRGTSNGPTLLITAGNDGDEYAGIAAAYTLIEEFSQRTLSGVLHIIPIVNIPGFEAEMSKNPLDNKFPKYIFPGNSEGSSSEKLRHWLYTEYAQKSDFWLDLHGGALTEELTPFAWGWKSLDSSIDTKVLSVLNKFNVQYAAFTESFDMIRVLAKHNCAYTLIESGAGGTNDVASSKLHIDCVHSVMECMGMISEEHKHREKHIFSNVIEYQIRSDGIWHLNDSLKPSIHIKKGENIGVVTSLDGTITQSINAKKDGIILWVKTGLRASKNDVIAGIGTI